MAVQLEAGLEAVWQEAESLRRKHKASPDIQQGSVRVRLSVFTISLSNPILLYITQMYILSYFFLLFDSSSEHEAI